MTYELWSHQTNMIEHAEACLQAGLNGAWWLAGCSTGKTYASLEFARRQGYKTIIVMSTNAAAEDAWQSTVTQHFPEYEFRLVLGTEKQRKKALEGLPERFVLAIGYSSSWRHILPHVDLIIADESQKLKAHNSKVSQNAMKMKSLFKLDMTGTAFDDRPTDAFGQMRFIDKTVLGTDYDSFFVRYTNYYSPPTNPYVKIPIGYKNHEHLAKLLAPYLIRVDSEKVLDLPPQLDIVKSLKFPAALSKPYKEFAKNYITELDGEVLTAANAGVLAMRLHQMTGGQGSPKLQATLDIMDEIGGKPTVIFTRFSEEVDLIEAALSKEGYKVLKLVGGLHQHLEFQRGEGDVIIVNMEAGSEGIDLTRARYVIYYSTGYKRTSYIQSRYRCRRANSPDKKNPITFYHLQVAGTIDETIAKVLEDKGEETNLLLTEIEKVWYNSAVKRSRTNEQTKHND